MSTIYCRLCAEPKAESDLGSSISETKTGILEKLTICCQWNSYPYNSELPDRICHLCSEKLEKSWIFNECVAEAQRKLIQLLNEGELSIKCEPEPILEEDLFCDPEDIFVEPIPLPDIYLEPTDHLIGSTLEAVNDDIKSHPPERECDICHKVFTTGYNLTVDFFYSSIGFDETHFQFLPISFLGPQKSTYK